MVNSPNASNPQSECLCVIRATGISMRIVKYLALLVVLTLTLAAVACSSESDSSAEGLILERRSRQVESCQRITPATRNWRRRSKQRAS